MNQIDFKPQVSHGSASPEISSLSQKQLNTGGQTARGYNKSDKLIARLLSVTFFGVYLRWADHDKLFFFKRRICFIGHAVSEARKYDIFNLQSYAYTFQS